MHVGLIGGIGPAATEHYYRGLIERHAKSNTTLDLTIVQLTCVSLRKTSRIETRNDRRRTFCGWSNDWRQQVQSSPLSHRWVDIFASRS